MASLGMLASSQEHREALLTQDIITNVLKAARAHIGNAKLLKTALGCLINLTAGKESQETLTKDPSFYQILYTVIEEKKYRALIEYMLRLVCNTLHINTSLLNYQSGALIAKLCDFVSEATMTESVTFVNNNSGA